MIAIVCGVRWHVQILWTNIVLHKNSGYISRREVRYYISGLTWHLAVLDGWDMGRYIYNLVIYKPQTVTHPNWHCVRIPGEQRPCLSWLCHLLTAVLGKSNLVFKESHNGRIVAARTTVVENWVLKELIVRVIQTETVGWSWYAKNFVLGVRAPHRQQSIYR